MKEFKSNNQQTLEILERANTKEIKELFHNEKYDCSDYSDSTDTLLDLVIENSNDFTRDIASKMKEAAGKKYFSAKQAWCVAYQIINNIEVYISAMKELDEECLSEVVVENENFMIVDNTENTGAIYIGIDGDNCRLEENAKVYATEKEAHQVIIDNGWEEWSGVIGTNYPVN